MRRSLNVTRGMRRANREGRWTTTPPTGYMRSHDEEGRFIIVPDPDTAPLIQEAFRLAATGEQGLHLPTDEIRRRIRELARERLGPHRARGFYGSRYRFGAMLRNPVYMGMVRVRAWKDEPEQLVQGVHEPLVSAETFRVVQQVLDGGKKKGGRKAKYVPELPLRGHLLCPRTRATLTGSASTARSGDRMWYYHGHGQGRGAFRCRADEANEAFAEHLKDVSIAPEIAGAFEDLFAAQLREHGENQAQQAARLETRRREIKDKLFRADEAWVEEKLTQESYDRLKARYQGELAAAEDDLARCHRLDAAFDAHLRFGLGLLTRLDEAWAALPPEGKHVLAGSIFSCGLVFDAGVIEPPRRARCST